MQYFDLFQRRKHSSSFFFFIFFLFEMAVPPQFCSVSETNQIDPRREQDVILQQRTSLRFGIVLSAGQ